MEVRLTKKFDGVYLLEFTKENFKRPATVNLTPGKSVYGEKLIKIRGQEYRVWDPYRSKLSAAILKGLETFPFKIGKRILYLGAATGTTVSHISDIIGENGEIYCVEFASRAMSKLIQLCEDRPNLNPLFFDARFPEYYASLVGLVDIVYCDVTQPVQAQIIVSNAKCMLKKNGWGILIVKARSIDAIGPLESLFSREVERMKAGGFDIKQTINLEPFDRDHILVVGRFVNAKF